VLSACESATASILQTNLSYGATVVAVGCYSWGDANPAIRAAAGNTYLTKCVFGTDIGGNANANTLDVQMNSYSARVFLEDCLLSGTTPVSVGTADTDPLVISTNHNQVSGARQEWQRYGTCTKATDTDFVEDVCDQIDPSSATAPFRYSFMFRCDTGKTPTLTFNQKGGGTLGACTVTLGYSRCGTTGIATGGTITPDTDGGVSSHSVTFTGTTDCAGEIEVIIEVLDSSSGLLSVGDFAVTGAE
jgi:hypothetical protein